jgi:DNA-binding beta-propeller fold protein YncE/mono/diheme cytochrome c family protein
MNNRKIAIISVFTVLIVISAFSLTNRFKMLADGPGLGNLLYTDAELFKPIFIFKDSNGAKKGHSSVAMHNGYLVIPGGRDSGQTGGGFSAFDVSNPKDPKLIVSKFDASTDLMREAHTIGFSSSYPGDYAAMITVKGVMFWDWTNIATPKILSTLTLPGVAASDYTNGAWWLCWQAPYLYVGGSANGIYIVDVKNPEAPKLITQVPKSKTGGFNIGSIFAVGNLLVTSMQENGDMAVLDISNPIDPKLISKFTGAKNYSTMVNGNRIYAAGTEGVLYVYDFSDPKNIKLVNKSGVVGGKGGYVNYQDGFVFMGSSSNAAKIDVRNDAAYTLVSKLTSNITNRDEDFAVPIGNLVLVGNDHENGSALIPHQKTQDLKGADITMVSPVNNAVNQAITSRVGVTMSDNIDLRTVNNTTFIVRPVGGAAIAGKYSLQTGILNFCPDAPLIANTVYEVLLPKNGIKDVTGNVNKLDFSSKFSTGSTINVAPVIDIVSSGPQEVNKVVNLEVKRTGGTATGTTTYTWDFGDGTPQMVTTITKVTHTYTKPNHYILNVESKDDVSIGNASDIQTIYLPVSAAKPVHSNTIIFDQETNKIWNTNQDSNTITISDANTFVKTKEVASGKRPRNLAKASNNQIWVTNQDDATISIYSDKGDPLKTIALPYASQPFGIVFSPNNSAAYVTLEATGRLLKLDLNGNIVASIPVGASPRAIAVSNDSKRIFVTRFISPEKQGEVVEVDAASFSIKRKINLVEDPGPDNESGGRGVPNYLNGIAINPSGTEAWVIGKKDNVSRGKYKDGQALTFESTVRSVACKIDLNSNTELLNNRIDIDNRDSPTDIVFSKLGDYAFITTQGNDLVEVRDAYKGVSVAVVENSGSAPSGIVLSPDGNKLFVNNFISRSVTVFDVSDVVKSLSNKIVRLAEIKTVSTELLSAEVLKGKKIFYSSEDRMSQGNYISCASCHVDGGQDGRAWDFTDRGEGIRNTTTLVGSSGIGHGRVHWSGNFDEIQDFENDIRNAFKGKGFMSDKDFEATSDPLGNAKKGLSADLDALAAYVTSLSTYDKSPYKNADGSLTKDAVSGKAIFESKQCASCHTGSSYTDSDKGFLHDVGTMSLASGGRRGKSLLGIDTPTLRGIWKTAPYLHDGSAATLNDVFLAYNKDDKHGVTSTLSRTEMDQLVTYLKQIDGATPASTTPAISLKLSSPLNKAIFEEEALVNLAITSDLKDISEVVYFANGVEVARTKTAPFSEKWKGTPGKNYEINAKVYHGKISTTTSEVNISYKKGAKSFFTSVTPKNAATYQIKREITTNMIFRTDRDYTVEEVINPFVGAEIILSPNNDKTITEENFLTIQIAAQGIVYVAMDPRVTTIPNWLKTWTKTGLLFKTSDVDFIVYQKSVTAGTLVLGGNLAAGATGTGSNYVVIGKSSDSLLQARLTSPTNNSSFAVNSNINISTTVTPNASDVVRVEYYANHLKIGSSTTGPNFSYNWKSNQPGNVELYAIVIDKNGNQIITEVADIVITGSINKKPSIVINTPINNAVYKIGETITAEVTANDIDGKVNMVEYYLNDKYIGNSTLAPFKFTFSESNQGNFVLTAIAIDDKAEKSDVSFGVDLTIKSNLGLFDFEDIQQDFDMFPNPASKNVTISGIKVSEISQVTLFNTKGEYFLCDFQKISDEEILLDVNRFAEGFYIVSIKKMEAVLRKKLLIQR